MRRLAPIARALAATALVAAAAGPLDARAGEVEPAVDILRDGTVEGTVVVGATVDRVRALVGDVARLRRMSRDVKDVAVRREGDCVVVTTRTASVLEVNYTARRCPTADGWVETLLESDTFNDYYSEWFVHSVADGVLVRFRLRTVADLPVPDRLVRGALKKGVESVLEAIGEELGGPHDPPARVAEP